MSAKPHTIIGIDPGKSGAIAWIGETGSCVEKMPETLQDIWDLMNAITNGFVAYRSSNALMFKAYIEQVHSMPGQGVASSFAFGRQLGNLEMALTAAGIPFERVTPQKWQRAMSCMTGGNKNVSKAKAQELFPQHKVTHKTADALLIAEYGRRQNA